MQNQFLTEEPAPGYVPFAAPPQTTEADTLVTTAQTQAVTVLLAATKRKVRKRKIIFWISFFVMEGLMLIDRAVSHFSVWLGLDSHFSHTVSRTPWIPFFVLAGGVSLVYTMLRPMGFDADELARVGGVRAIPALLDSLNSGTTPGQRRVIYRALTLLLPQMQASDAHLLTAFHRRILNNLLRWGRGFNFDRRDGTSIALAILKAYEQVGNAKAIPVVESLAKIRGNSERKRKVREAAQECLPLLQSHLGELNTMQTLLRASSPSTSAPDVLLRAAAEASPAPAGELLRAGGDEALTD